MAAVLDGRRYARDGESRAFSLAVGASIVVHALILFSMKGLVEPDKKPDRLAPGPIVARLAQPAAAPPPPAREEAPKPKAEEPPPAPPPPPQATPQPAPRAKPAAVPTPAPATRSAPSTPSPPQTAPSTTETPRTSETAPVAPAPSSTAPVAKADPAPQAPAPPAPALAADPSDAATLGQYRIAIISAAKRYKRYPRVAMDNNWEGKVEIRMVIGANGMIASIGIKTGTGHEILDAQALDMIRKAKPLTPIPASLRGKEFTVDVPVFFSLKEETG